MEAERDNTTDGGNQPTELEEVTDAEMEKEEEEGEEESFEGTLVNIDPTNIKCRELDMSYIEGEEKKNLLWKLAVKDRLAPPFIIEGPGRWHMQKLKRIGRPGLERRVERNRKDAEKKRERVNACLKSLLQYYTSRDDFVYLAKDMFRPAWKAQAVDAAIHATYLELEADFIEEKLLRKKMNQ